MQIINKKINYYYFCYSLNEKTKNNIIKIKNLKLIYYKETSKITSEELKDLLYFCKKNRVQFFLKDNYKLSLKVKATGVYISSNKRSLFYQSKNHRKIIFIGSAHNQIEFFFKKKQNCSLISLSPLFYNKKYSINKILELIKFKLISMNWDIPLIALGGIKLENVNKVKNLKILGLGFSSLIEDL